MYDQSNRPFDPNAGSQSQPQRAPSFCIYCGNKLVPGDQFCRQCGKRLQSAAAPANPEDQLKRQYDQAVKLLEASRFDEALQIFNRLADYSDAKDKAALCVQGKQNAQKERLYVSAVAVLSMQKVSGTEIKQAIQTLTSIADYKDAQAKLAQLEALLEKWQEAKKAAEDAAYKRRYEAAVSYMNSGAFDQAIQIFQNLGDYSDSKAQISKALEAKEAARKEQLYNRALAVLATESSTDSLLKEAIAALKSIENYKNAKEKILELEVRLKKWYEDKAAAEEAERIRKAKAKARAKKITILSIIAVLLAAIIVAGILFVTKDYRIEYNLDGGTIEKANASSYTMLTDDIVLANPTKEGYTFTGWTGTELQTPTLNVTIPKWSLGNRDYKAHWKANSYTITFDTDGGVGAALQSVTFGEIAELPTPTKEGYTFAGWFAGNTPYTSGEWKDASDLTLTAIWAANSYTITFQNTASGYVYSSYGSISEQVKFDNHVALSTPTRRGYTFLGWYNGNTKVESGVWKYASDISLTPKWQASTHTITLNANGGTVSTNKVPVTYDQVYTLPVPTKTGYTFNGWYKGSTKYTGGTWNELSDITLVASWTANSYTLTLDDVKYESGNVVVTFNPNYSGASATTVTLTNGQTLNYPAPPIRSGYAFAGWYTDSACTTPYNFSGTITGNMTLYAKWVAMASSYSTREYVNIASYNSSYSKKSFTVSASSSSSPNYYYFTCYKAGSYTIYTNRSAGDFYIAVYNATTGSSIISNYNLYGSSTSKSASFTANAGDVIYVRLHKYSSSGSTGSGTFYVSGASYPSSTATANSSTVSGYMYNSNMSATQSITFGSAFALPTPVRTGYTFLGWYNGTTKLQSGVWNFPYNITLTPRWEPVKNTITLNANGGTVSNTSIAVTYGSAYTLPTPTRTGYTFNGWYNGSTKYTSGTWNELSNVTLVASWTANSYTLTFKNLKVETANVVVTLNPNYSGASATTVTLTNGQTLNYPAPPIRSGYAFVGWYTDSACTTPYNFSGTINSNMTLHAKWVAMSSSYSTREYVNIASYNSSSSKKSFTVSASSSASPNYYYFTCYKAGSYTIYTNRSAGDFYIAVYNATTGSSIISNYNLYSSSTSISASFTANAGDVIYVRLHKYSSSGSTGSGTFYVSGASYPTSTATANCNSYSGYAYDPSLTISQSITFGDTFTLPTPVRTGYTFLGWYNGTTKMQSGTWNFPYDVTLTPKWQADLYAITLNANGGTVSNNSITVAYGTAYTLPTPTRVGYSFNGWYNGSTKYSSGTWYDQANITLVAQWTANTYNLTLNNTAKRDIVVTFDKNYTNSTPAFTTLKDGDALPYPTDPVRSGYVFTGWFVDSACTTRYSFSETLSQDITLYAGWKAVSFTNVYSKAEINPVDYTSSSDYFAFSTYGTSSNAKNYLYLVAQESGTHSIYYANSSSSSSYKYYLTIYNWTTNSTIKSTATVSSTSFTPITFTCAAGDVIVIEIYKYSSSSSAFFYFVGFSPMTSTTVVQGEAYMYSESLNHTMPVTYNTDFTLPTPTRDGYRFLGWYDGSTKVESGTWSYTSNVTLTASWQEVVYYTVTLSNAKPIYNTVLVTLNYNNGGTTNGVALLNYGDTFAYPEPPTRTGYAFAGWYTDIACTIKFNFGEVITKDITLYAKWVALQSSPYGSEYIKIENYTTSGQQKSITASSGSSYNYYYFTCHRDGTYTFYGTWIEGDFKLTMTNVTTGTTITNNYNLYSNQPRITQSFTAKAGDVICVQTIRYSSSYSYNCNGIFYVLGTGNPTGSLVESTIKEGEVGYSTSNSYTMQVEYGAEFTLPTINRPGFTFLGWYYGNTKVEPGIWNIDSNVILTPRWQ